MSKRDKVTFVVLGMLLTQIGAVAAEKARIFILEPPSYWGAIREPVVTSNKFGLVVILGKSGVTIPWDIVKDLQTRPAIK